MERIQKKEIWAFILALLCAGLFVYSGLEKAIEWEKFRTQMGKSPILTGWEDILIWVIPPVEVGNSILLAVPKTRILGFYLFFTLMFLFTGYIILLLNMSEKPPCGCNALLESLSLQWHVVINVVFIGLSVVGLINRQQIENKASC